jgi:aspartokinase/homoserine dehydrogenase 1
MKFGGTSVGDASCIARVAKIVKDASREGPVVVVVSAMSGVTNRLIEAATKLRGRRARSGGGGLPRCASSTTRRWSADSSRRERRSQLAARVEAILDEGERLCKGTALLRELTPRTLDAVSSLGERLSAPMVAGALEELGVRSESVEATELIVTDPYHGGADPLMDRTREHAQRHCNRLLQDGITPVVTGFIGATEDGVLTTLGRGGSDYSATILGAAMDADEIIIWTDVDGVLTADPRLVAEARTIPEISYREATELAYFGAKVLHPKTLRAVVQAGNSRVDPQQLCAGENRHKNHAKRKEQRRRREGADGDQGRDAGEPGRPGNRGRSGCAGANFFNDGGSAGSICC